MTRCTDAAAGTAGLTAFGFLRETHQLCAAMRGEVQLAHRPSMLGGDRMVESLAQEYVPMLHLLHSNIVSFQTLDLSSLCHKDFHWIFSGCCADL